MQCNRRFCPERMVGRDTTAFWTASVFTKSCGIFLCRGMVALFSAISSAISDWGYTTLPYYDLDTQIFYHQPFFCPHLSERLHQLRCTIRASAPRACSLDYIALTGSCRPRCRLFDQKAPPENSPPANQLPPPTPPQLS